MMDIFRRFLGLCVDDCQPGIKANISYYMELEKIKIKELEDIRKKIAEEILKCKT